jgi:hypothetical protein
VAFEVVVEVVVVGWHAGFITGAKLPDREHVVVRRLVFESESLEGPFFFSCSSSCLSTYRFLVCSRWAIPIQSHPHTIF